jgi:alkyl sulfatase BDS1-like metallo-beta-lactamase superfamily hydrolase
VEGTDGGAAPVSSAGMAGALTIEQLFDSIAIRVVGPKAWSEAFTIDWSFTDSGERYRMTLSNGALSHWRDPKGTEAADLTVTLTKPALLGLLGGNETQGIQTEGDSGLLQKLTSLTDQPDPSFNIVMP